MTCRLTAVAVLLWCSCLLTDDVVRAQAYDVDEETRQLSYDDKIVLPTLQAMKLTSSFAIQSIEDCYGFNVRIWKVEASKCYYMKSTYTTCLDETHCAELPSTICLNGYCQCREGYGVANFIIDQCNPITYNQRWKHESKRSVIDIAKKLPWGVSGEYSMASRYNGMIVFVILGLLGGSIFSLVGEWLKDKKNRSKARKDRAQRSGPQQLILLNSDQQPAGSRSGYPLAVLPSGQMIPVSHPSTMQQTYAMGGSLQIPGAAPQTIVTTSKILTPTPSSGFPVTSPASPHSRIMVAS